MMTILAFTNWYLPGYKGGGPIRSISNMAHYLGDEFRFKIVTADRDFGDTSPYPAVLPGLWQQVGKAQVRYLAPHERSVRAWAKLLHSTSHDLLYFNSYFSPDFTIRPLLARKCLSASKARVVLAPRGEFGLGALACKRGKKALYRIAAESLHLYEGVVWQATTVYERNEILVYRGSQSRPQIQVAPNLCSPIAPAEECIKKKQKGYARFLFLSRISPKKNLDKAIQLLAGLRGNVEFKIVGPVDDDRHWARCLSLIGGLPGNITVRCGGTIPHENVAAEYGDNDFLFLPTASENFGHVIIEAMLAGCPVVISDQTPWRDLEAKGVGWDLPLSRPDEFRRRLQNCVDMDSVEFARWSRRAREFARDQEQNPTALRQTRELFLQGLNAYKPVPTHSIPLTRPQRRPL
jgi:glycosyltransferase involved in cell wall biosynthesis